MPVMEIRQLEYFVTVVEEAGFTRAAERLHVAQPGISAQIRRLERELGQELLDRSGRSVRPTQAGAAALPHARAALASLEGVRRAVDEVAGLVRGRLAIGTVTAHTVTAFGVDLAVLLAAFRRDHPGVEITLAEDTSDRLVGALSDGGLDAAIISYGAEPPAGLDVLVVTDQTISAVFAPEDEFAQRGGTTLPVAALRDRPLICLPRGTGVRTLFDEACAAAGFTPRIAFEAGTPTVLAQFAAQGLGVAIVPGSVAEGRKDMRELTLVEPELHGRLGFAWRAGGPTSSAARELVGRARRLMGSREDPM
jgi:DNA-binding transcriptional LysR family regulator